VRQIVDESGEVVFYQAYEPYGDVLYSTGADSDSSSYGFAGEWTDATGLQYLRARYYDTGIGRFTTRDAYRGDYQYPLTLNRWMYVNGNPIIYVDRSGYMVDNDASYNHYNRTIRDYSGRSITLEEARKYRDINNAINVASQVVDNGWDAWEAGGVSGAREVISRQLVEDGSNYRVFGSNKLLEDALYNPQTRYIGINNFKKAGAQISLKNVLTNKEFWRSTGGQIIIGRVFDIFEYNTDVLEGRMTLNELYGTMLCNTGNDLFNSLSSGALTFGASIVAGPEAGVPIGLGYSVGENIWWDRSRIKQSCVQSAAQYFEKHPYVPPVPKNYGAFNKIGDNLLLWQ
jgi:RHS repeat-associated protein